jgi:polysaccharide export outer membrane protein
MRSVFKYMVFIWIIAVMAGCSSTGGGRLPEQGTGRAPLIDEYRIDVGDQLTINVWKNGELSTSGPVRPDGKIAVPLVGDILAVGKTPEELAAEVEVQLSGFIKDPNVTIILTGLQGQSYLSRILVTGAVGSTSYQTYQQGMTVLDAVLGAGGVSLYADANRTKLHRRTETGIEIYDIPLNDIINKGDLRSNVYLVPGDVITVPESVF